MYFDGTFSGNAIRGSYKMAGLIMAEMADMVRNRGAAGIRTTTMEIYK